MHAIIRHKQPSSPIPAQTEREKYHVLPEVQPKTTTCLIEQLHESDGGEIPVWKHIFNILVANRVGLYKMWSCDEG